MNKNNKGGALTMVLALLIFTSYMGLMILNLAYTNIEISKSYVGDRRMYRGTDYVVNLISMRLKKDIKDIQEEARSETESYFDNPNNLKTLNQNAGHTYLIETGSISEEDYSYEFNKKYNEVYKTKFQESNYYKEKVGFSQSTLDALITNGKDKVLDGGIQYFKTNLIEGETIYYRLIEGSYDENEKLITLVMETKFEYNNDITRYGGKYNLDNKTNLQTTNKATVVFKVSDNNEDFSLQNYKLVNTKNDELPIFQNQTALLAEKNIIFVQKNNSGEDNTTITGDVVSFGYIPTNETSKWTDYGGVLFGYTNKISGSTVFGSAWYNKMSGLVSGTRYAGNVTINGNVVTMGYVDVACNKDRVINIKGDTFARQFILSEDSHESKVYLGDDIETNHEFVYNNDTVYKNKNELLRKGNLCVTDDLQVDSSYSNLIVKGDFYGLADKYSSVGGSDGSDFTNEKKISTLNINGNSIVELRRKVYIGGTSVLANIKNSNGYAYTTGISGAKTSQILAEAYIKSAKNPSVYDQYGVAKTPVTEEYTYSEPGMTDYQETGIDMINGYTGKIGDDFLLSDRAIHFKKYFDENVKNNFGLMGTMNFGNLRIQTDAQGNIQGWANGVIIAAGVKDFSNVLGDGTNVNAYYDGSSNGSKFSEGEMDVFNGTNPYSQYSMIQKYQSQMLTFIDDFGDSTGRAIVQTSPDKHLTNYLSDSSSVMNVIKNSAGSSSYLYKTDTLNAILYYSKNQTTVIGKNGNDKITIGGQSGNIPNKGIIFCEGDIYIQDGVKFTGTIVAGGNITIEGSVDITRYRDYYDSSANRADIVNELKDKDCYVKTFFGLNDYELDANNNVRIQRINQDYAKIVKWTLE